MSKELKGWVVLDSKSDRFFNGTDWALEKEAHRFPTAIIALEEVSKIYEVVGGSSITSSGGPYDGIVSVVLLSDIPIDKSD